MKKSEKSPAVWLNISQAAKYLGLTRAQFDYGPRKEKRIPSYEHPYTTRYRKEDLDAYIQSIRQESDPLPSSETAP